MGKHQQKLGTALATFLSGASLIASGASAQETTPEDTKEQAAQALGLFKAARGQEMLDWFNQALASMEAARAANDCETWMSSSQRAKYIFDESDGYGDLPDATINQMYRQFVAARAEGCQPPDEEGLDVASVIGVATSSGLDLDFEVAQIRDLADRCRYNARTDEENEFLDSQKDRYGRHYREVEAAMREYRELSLTTDDEALAQSYAENARKYERALEGMPKPWEFPCASYQPMTTLGERPTGNPRFLYSSIELDFGEEDILATGIGFAREGAPGTAPETFATQAPIDVDYLGLAASLHVDGYSVDAFYREGDGSASSSIAGGGSVDAGIVYGALSPSGSSGIATPFGLDSVIEVEAQSYGIGGSVDFYSAGGNRRFDTLSADSVRNRILLKWAGVRVGYQHTERDFSGTASGSGTQSGFTFEFGQTREQKISEDQFHLAVEAELGMSFSERVALRSQLRAGAYYRDTSLRSVEVNHNNFTGPPDETFTVTIDRDDDGLGFQGSVDLFLDFNLSPGPGPGPVLSIGGGIEYQSSTGGIFNPSSGDQVFFEGLTTDLITGETLRWYAGVGIALPL